ncbi:MAG: ZIP family metal transporter [Armatimonadetes bacterium]|nr:ZIP family metal transporter [Armatimonadota bacterium]
MDPFLIALGFALLPAFGNFAGGLLAEAFTVSGKTLSIALHAAAGVLLAVVSVELLPQALEAKPSWLIILLFFLGGVFFIAMDQTIHFVRARMSGAKGEAEAGAGPWMLFFGVAIDLFSDGVMIGTSTTIATSLALLLALGQVTADVPEGFATVAAFKNQGIPRRSRLLISAAFTIPILLGTTLGYWAVRGLPEIYKLGLLTFTAGLLMTLVVEEIIPEAHEDGEARLAAFFFIGGFSLFALLSAYLG